MPDIGISLGLRPGSLYTGCKTGMARRVRCWVKDRRRAHQSHPHVVPGVVSDCGRPLQSASAAFRREREGFHKGISNEDVRNLECLWL